MDINDLIKPSGNNQDLLWDTFRYEQILEETEEDLLKDLEYYNKKLKLLGSAGTTLDISIATVYKAHIKSIKRLLDVINKIKKHGLDGSRQLNIFHE
jgi:hypothetical protein